MTRPQPSSYQPVSPPRPVPDPPPAPPMAAPTEAPAKKPMIEPQPLGTVIISSILMAVAIGLGLIAVLGWRWGSVAIGTILLAAGGLWWATKKKPGPGGLLSWLRPSGASGRPARAGKSGPGRGSSLRSMLPGFMGGGLRGRGKVPAGGRSAAAAGRFGSLWPFSRSGKSNGSGKGMGSRLRGLFGGSGGGRGSSPPRPGSGTPGRRSASGRGLRGLFTSGGGPSAGGAFGGRSSGKGKGSGSGSGGSSSGSGNGGGGGKSAVAGWLGRRARYFGFNWWTNPNKGKPVTADPVDELAEPSPPRPLPIPEYEKDLPHQPDPGRQPRPTPKPEPDDDDDEPEPQPRERNPMPERSSPEWAGSDEASLVRWHNGLKAVPAVVETEQRWWRSLAGESHNHKVPNVIREALDEVVADLGRLTERTQSWHTMVGNAAKPWLDAWNNPHDGSVHTESKADVARNDGGG